ncbi:MAG: hypothetical protein ABI539_08835 [Acidobacteriota bacterium]
MKVKSYIFFALILSAATIAYGQNRFEGYSFIVGADSGGACPVRFLPNSIEGNTIEVYLAGTNQKTAASGLTACDGSRVLGNRVAPNGSSFRWCFEGSERMYETKLTNGTVNLWYPLSKELGTYNVEDFRPVSRTSGSDPQYVFTKPADYSETIRRAVAFIAVRNGGTLIFPDGDYVVGTLDGNRRDPAYQGITLPSGITVTGTSTFISTPTTNLPMWRSAARIRLRNENQTIFRIGGCTIGVTVKNIELLGNTPLYGEGPRSSVGNYGIEAVGKWAIDPVSKAHTPNSSQFFRFENVVFQNLDTGIRVGNANGDRCDNNTQACNQWQFDYVKVDHGIFVNNRTGIYIDTFNTDWNITNSTFFYMAALAPGDGIRIKRAGSILVEQSFGGGYNYAEAIGGTFLNIDTIGSLTVINSAAERARRSIFVSEMGGVASLNLTVIGSTFGDKIELNGRMNYISTGNFYGPRSVRAQPGVTITSTGDRFCYDPLVLPGQCYDENRKAVSDPGFGSGRMMFKTGRFPEGSGANILQGQPNQFGYDLQISNGLLQLDSNITFRDITGFAAGSPGRPPVTDGAIVYCKDCRKNASGVCTEGRAGTDGAFAKRINGQWRCD